MKKVLPLFETKPEAIRMVALLIHVAVGCMYSPWSEKVNRQITSVLANCYFTLTSKNISKAHNLYRNNKACQIIIKFIIGVK